MVLEYFEHDLSGLLSMESVKFSVPQIKCYLRQLLEAVHQCHSAGVMHRDVKAANVLINNQVPLQPLLPLLRLLRDDDDDDDDE
jgi:cyclin-dependent kinase 12/13